MIRRPPRSTLFPYTNALPISPRTRRGRIGCDGQLGRFARGLERLGEPILDRKSTRLNSSHSQISYAVFCLKKKKNNKHKHNTLLKQLAQRPKKYLSSHTERRQ